MSRKFLACLLILSLGACRSSDMTMSGSFKAKVFDAVSCEPVMGAKITLKSDQNSAVTAEGLSDHQGQVVVPPLFGSFISYPPMESVLTATATVEALEYKSVTLSSSRDRLYFQYPNRNGPPATLYLERN